HELAPIYTTVNVAVDQNQLTMETMKKVAAKHGMTCLLHEKPFEYLNGSGKHNNWSLTTNFGHNLFNPGKSPEDNAQFLLMLAAVIAAVDKHQDLLRIAVASASNDHRLGANEAPPAIISMYLGDEITGILQAIADGRTYSTRAKCDVKIGVHVLPTFAMDSADRNRTSPFAFTGNKFEFRMPGSSQSIADVNMVLNTIMAEEFELFADELEKAKDFNEGIGAIIKRVMHEHGRIIFNGNNYSKDWEAEAKRRGLLSLKNTVAALERLCTDDNIKFFEKMGVMSEVELRSRQETSVESYCKIINIEANTMLDIATKDIIPAVLGYKKDLAIGASKSLEAGISADVEISIANRLEMLIKAARTCVDNLKEAVDEAHKLGNGFEGGKCYASKVLDAMDALRKTCDELEVSTAKAYWPMPNYADVLFSVH
ncbi:MAG: glutamine synthetase type III, partial [Clostridia bacterium]|nr:glutamine synthetase type III [Clostridia bacterium]